MKLSEIPRREWWPCITLKRLIKAQPILPTCPLLEALSKGKLHITFGTQD